jgi:peroxiredoxin
MKKSLIFSLIAVIIIAVTLFFIFSNSEEESEIESKGLSEVINQVILDTELKNVNTGETFKISDFQDKPVLLESFAVWCPTCTQQQRITKDFHKEVGDSVISISLDTDPNEDETKIKEHATQNGFNWYYAIAPVDFTKTLIDQFGVGIVNAPSVPMLLICDGKVKKLSSGLKQVSELKEEVAKCQS